ncbi:hypothetical protein NLU13_0711 [Sarocladium strictum]|uniref:EthD domain-containing protein n=1 Tax=Sarocladium strictum TaxID=5046 RepID=A0AA39GPK2_SARSR|nr:hypothetical protein NLU13_0711 [Sarocladium strictum]
MPAVEEGVDKVGSISRTPYQAFGGIQIPSSPHTTMAAKQAIVQVIYPAGDDTKFDMDYYLNTHMPLVEKHWGDKGLISWSIIVGEKGEDFHVMAHLTWDKVESFANAPHIAEVMGDIPNFTNTTPAKRVGSVVASSS